ncbi:MAG: sialidase family protein [Rhodospirillaceae bacterium]
MKHVIFACAYLAASSAAAMDHSAHMAQEKSNACADSALACSDKAQPFFDKDGTLWLAWQGGGRIAVAQSKDGRAFTAPVFVTPRPLRVDVGADSRPQIVRDAAGVISVIYSVMQTSGFNGRIYLSQSQDEGKTFSPPQPVTDDPASQRFPALSLAPNGRTFALWIDKRAAHGAKLPYDGAALAFSWFDGKGPVPMQVAQDHSCECCRIAVAFDPRGNPAMMWRQIFSGMVRDHAVMTFAGGRPGAMHRVSEDKWHIEACPHHGPALAITADGAYHAAWFTEGEARQGLFYASSQDAGVRFSTPEAIGSRANNPGRAQLLAVGNDLWLAWQEFDGETVSILAKRRRGSGWTAPRVVATTTDASDHPVLTARGTQAYLSWLTTKEGYRLIALESEP